VCVKDGELIAIQTNVEVHTPIDNDVLGDYFTFSDGFYTQVGDIPTLMDKAELRDYLYHNGFKCDGIEYVRYKRSSGSSRVGKCLFVNKALADDMTLWDKCGLKIEEGQNLDLAAWEAYISLPMSSIIDTVEIPLDSILIIDDYESVFDDEVVAVEIEDGHLVSNQKNATIKNSIWDGQSLMDSSLFEKYPDKGMLLLRNRFFKSCCFNTNLQQWFEDNHIVDISQLNGFTLAKEVSQIKLVTTPSSIKYLKFGTVEQWLSTVDPVFGIVKYEKPPHAFDGRMVQAHYQLFNTLQLSYKEMEKILENTYRNINIGLVNELAMLCEKMNISLWEVVDAAKTKPYGFQAFYPGPGLGGHCIPLDPYYLDWKAREYGFHTSLIQASGIINDKMPEYCVERASKILSSKLKKALNGADILVLGVAYKNDIDDYRESPALKVIDLLKKAGANVCFYDPYILEYKYNGETQKGLTKIDEKIVSEKDLVIFTAAHSNYDYEMISKNAKAIFDTRNAMKNIENRENIELL